MTPGPLVQRLVSALMEEPSHDSFNKLGILIIYVFHLMI